MMVAMPNWKIEPRRPARGPARRNGPWRGEQKSTVENQRSGAPLVPSVGQKEHFCVRRN